MSWSINASGKDDEVGIAFDKMRAEMKVGGMLEAELSDIDEIRDTAMQFANQYGAVNVSASGHWINFGADDPRTGFGQVQVTISKATM